MATARTTVLGFFGTSDQGNTEAVLQFAGVGNDAPQTSDRGWQMTGCR